MQHKTFGTLIGSYGKGIADSATVNFAPSGGKHCDDSCALKRAGCYAVQTEKVKPSVRISLERRQDRLAEFLTAVSAPKAIAKLQAAPWVRFCAFGSIPAAQHWTPEAKASLAKIGAALQGRPVHWPTETLDKAEIIRDAGLLPRVSVGTNAALVSGIIRAGHVASCVVAGPKRVRGNDLKRKRANSQPAFDFAAELRRQGVTAKVCPAVAGRAKCGDCTACARFDVQVIVYPQH